MKLALNSPPGTLVCMCVCNSQLIMGISRNIIIKVDLDRQSPPDGNRELFYFIFVLGTFNFKFTHVYVKRFTNIDNMFFSENDLIVVPFVTLFTNLTLIWIIFLIFKFVAWDYFNSNKTIFMVT